MGIIAGDGRLRRPPVTSWPLLRERRTEKEPRKRPFSEWILLSIVGMMDEKWILASLCLVILRGTHKRQVLSGVLN